MMRWIDLNAPCSKCKQGIVVTESPIRWSAPGEEVTIDAGPMYQSRARKIEKSSTPRPVCDVYYKCPCGEVDYHMVDERAKWVKDADTQWYRIN